MKTSEEIKKEFCAKLESLLAEYGAYIQADDHFMEYAECGEDIRMTVNIPSKWSDDRTECLSEYTEISLGEHFP